MHVKEIVLQVLLCLVALLLAGVDDLHRICAATLENAYPEFQLSLQLFAAFSISCIAKEDILHSLTTRVHILNTLDESFHHLETAELIQSVQAFL